MATHVDAKSMDQIVKKRRRAEQNGSSTDFAYYDDLRKHPDVVVSPICNVTNGAKSHVARYTLDESSYRLIKVGVFLPFTSDGMIREATFKVDAIAVMLAAHHFNTASKAVLDHVRPESCDLRLTLEFFDTQESPMVSGRIVNNDIVKRNSCDHGDVGVILGLRQSSVAFSVGIVANTHRIPLISDGATSSQLENKEYFPYFSRVVASSEVQANAAIAYLQQLNVTHVNLLTTPGHSGQAYYTAFVHAAQSKEIRISSATLFSNWDTIIQRIATSKYRFTLAVIENMDQYEAMMISAYQNGMISDQFVWIVYFDAIDPYMFEKRAIYPRGSPLEIASRGVGFIGSVAGLNELHFPEFHRFLKSHETAINNKEFMQAMEEKLQKINATNDPFLHRRADHEHSEQCAFLYDSLLSIGLAACEADDEYFSGPSLQQKLLLTNFSGVSGHVLFDKTTGSRDPHTARVSVSYTDPRPQADGMIAFHVKTSAVFLATKELEGSNYSTLGFYQNELKSEEQRWFELTPFIYNGGTASLPLPLPKLEVSIKGVDAPFLLLGFIFGVSSLLLAIVATVWTWRHRKSIVVRKSQPIFLLMISVGAALMAWGQFPAIIAPFLPHRLQEVTCLATWFIYSTGLVIAFTALFAKTWRLNKIMRAKNFTKITVKPRDVYLPFAIFITLNTIILTSWAVLAPPEYRIKYFMRQDEFGRSDVEGIKGCFPREGSISPPFLFPSLLVALHLTLLAFTTWHSARTSSVKAEYNETFYIGMALMIVLQTWLLGYPLLVAVQAFNANATLISICLIATMSSVGMTASIVIPKVRALRDYKAAKERRKIEREKRQQMQEQIRSVRLLQEEQAFKTRSLSRQPAENIHSDLHQGTGHTEGRRPSVTKAVSFLSTRRPSRKLPGVSTINDILEDGDSDVKKLDSEPCQAFNDMDAMSVLDSSVISVSSSTTPVSGSTSTRKSLRSLQKDGMSSKLKRHQIPKEIAEVPSRASLKLRSKSFFRSGSIKDSEEPTDNGEGLSFTSKQFVPGILGAVHSDNNSPNEVIETQRRRRSSLQILTEVLFGGSFSDSDDDFDDDENNDEDENDDVAVDMDASLDVHRDLDDARKISRGVDNLQLPSRFGDTYDGTGSSLTLGESEEGLRLTVLETKKLASGPSHFT